MMRGGSGVCSSQDDVDQEKEQATVVLYQPASADGAGYLHHDGNHASHVGGTATDSSFHEPPNCSSCHNAMHLLLCLRLPEKKRTYYVFGCNRGSCGERLFENSNRFSLGGDGVFVVKRCKLDQQQPEKQQDYEQKTTIENEQVMQDLNDNDWDLSGDDDETDLEAMVAAMENMGSSNDDVPPRKSTAKQSKPEICDPSSSSNNNVRAFPCVELVAMPEPLVHEQEVEQVMQYEEEEEEDTIGMDVSKGDDKIQQMLARYMQDEDDEDILAALGGGNNNTSTDGSGGGRGGEKEERLSREDRFLFAFMDKVKLAPHQVVRYHVGGGEPMWSVPTPLNNAEKNKNCRKGRRGTHKQHNNNDLLTTFPQVPACQCCGAQRDFEFQIMPSLLHVLQVEKYAPKRLSPSDSFTIESAFANGGMNWGTIAIYTCPNQDCLSQEEFCVVQDSVDGKPTRRVAAAPPGEADDGKELCG